MLELKLSPSSSSSVRHCNQASTVLSYLLPQHVHKAPSALIQQIISLSLLIYCACLYFFSEQRKQGLAQKLSDTKAGNPHRAYTRYRRSLSRFTRHLKLIIVLKVAPFGSHGDSPQAIGIPVPCTSHILLLFHQIKLHYTSQHCTFLKAVIHFQKKGSCGCTVCLYDLAPTSLRNHTAKRMYD